MEKLARRNTENQNCNVMAALFKLFTLTQEA